MLGARLSSHGRAPTYKRKADMRKLLIILALMLPSTALGQIVTPAEVEPYTIATATAQSDVPPGAKVDGGWSASDGVSYVVVEPNKIVWTGPPGKHTLTFAGWWVNTKTVSFKDGDGNQITIESYLGSGRFNESAESVVGGAVPDPKPEPPNPGGKQAIVFFIQTDELDKMNYAQRYLVASLAARKNLEARGHQYLQVIDDDQIENPPAEWKSWCDAVKGDQLPRVAFSPIGGGPISDYPMPVDYKHLLELLGETP